MNEFHFHQPHDACPRCSGRGKVGGERCGCTTTPLDKRAPRAPLTEVTTSNMQAMLNLSIEFPEIRIRGSLRDWRPLRERPRGALRGLFDCCFALATDGIAAYFKLEDGRILYGHLANFVPDEKDATTREAKPKVKSVRQVLLESI